MGTWTGVIAVEGEVSVDGRRVEPGALTWDLPLPLFPNTETIWEREPIGSVDTIERDGELIRASGTYTELPDNWHGLSAATDENETEWSDSVLNFTAARIRAVYVDNNVLWPSKCIIETTD